MKRIKRVVAMILTVLMLVSVASVSAFAYSGKVYPYDFDEHRYTYGEVNANAKEYNIITFGDSTSLGYALMDYGAVAKSQNSSWFSCCGILDNASKQGTPYLFGQYVQDTLGKNYKVICTNLGLEGMRAEEIRSILDSSFVGDVFNQVHMDSYSFEYYEHALGNIHEVYANEVKNADCIVIDSLTNSFGTYLANRINGGSEINDVKVPYEETYLDVADQLIPGTKEKVTKVVDEMAKNLGLDTSKSMVQDVLDGLVYAYCSFTVSFTKDIELIRQLNPTAKIIVMGTFNAFDDLKMSVDVDGTTAEIDFAAVWDQYIKLADNFVTAQCPLSTQYVYAGLGDVEMFATGLAKCDSVENADKAFTRYLIEGIKDYVIAYNKVDNHINKLKQIATSDEENKIVYAFLKAAKNNVVDITSVMEKGLNWDLCNQFIYDCSQKSYEEIDKAFENIDSGMTSLLTVYIRLYAGYRSPGAHPDATGYQQKLSALKLAWINILPATTGTPVVIGTGLKNVASVTYTLNKSIATSIGNNLKSKLGSIRTR